MTSAAGYAEALSEYANKGSLNLQDAPDPPRAILGKAKVLADMILNARHVVVHTGAGLSTASGIADFRGPRGVWTQERQKGGRANEPPNSPGKGASFELARPSLAHMVIVGLYRAGFVKYVVSQNVDSLHLRSGIPRDALSELHGNVFVELCSQCGSEFVLECPTRTVGFKETGRKCPHCNGVLTDRALDWEDALPEIDFERAIENSTTADLNIVIGSSCQMNPARGLPFRNRGKNSKAVLINLSKTKQDGRFALALRSKCDVALAIVASELGIDVPLYERYIPFSLAATTDVCHKDLASANVRCRLWTSNNIDGHDSIPLLSQVVFSCVRRQHTDSTGGAAPPNADPLASRVCRSPPYSCDLPLDPDSIVQAELSFVGCGSGYLLPREPVSLSCVVSQKGCNDVTESIVRAGVCDYNEQAKLLVRTVEEDARKGLKRRLDAGVWFCRNAKRRGYVLCAACLEEVVATKKSEHLTACLSVKKPKPSPI